MYFAFNRYDSFISLIVLIFISHSSSLSAQTLSCQSNCPQAGDMFSMRTSSPVLTTAGTNQLWNFSNLAAISAASHIISYSSAAAVPSSSLYPQANLFRAGTGANAFLVSSNGGIREAFPNTLTANADAMLLPLPFAYGSTYSETIISSSISAGDTIITNRQIAFAAIGSGTLILPSGTFNDVLAIKYTSTQSAKKNGAPFGYITYNTSYYYYSSQIRHPLLYTKQLYESGPADYAPYTEFIDQIVTGIKTTAEVPGSDSVVFPNPANDFVNIIFDTNTKGRILIKNYSGQVLLEQAYTEGNCRINTSILPEGLYLLTFIGERISLNKKLVISR